MNKKLFLRACLITLLLLLISRGSVLAHEHIIVGDYEIVVGWANEPPVAGQANAVELSISNINTGEPVEDVTELTLAIAFGGESKTIALRPLGQDDPGEFIAPIVATRPGQYMISLGGMLGDTPVDADVQLQEVQPADTIEFPAAQVPAGGMNWLVWLSLLVGLVGVGLGAAALRRAGSR